MDITVVNKQVVFNIATTVLLEWLKSKPILKRMQLKKLFQELLQAKNYLPKFVVFNGNKSIGKTHFAANYLQEFCIENSLIAHRCETIQKLCANQLHFMPAAERDDFVNATFEKGKGNIIVLSDFPTNIFYTDIIAQKIESIKYDVIYKETIIILSNYYHANTKLIAKQEWQNLFSIHLSFTDATPSELTDIFSNYLLKKTHKLLNKEAQQSLWWYFKSKLKKYGKLDLQKEFYQLHKNIAYMYPNANTIDRMALCKTPMYQYLIKEINNT